MSQNRVLLLGLDFGSTTCSALIASAAMANDGIAGLAKFGAPQIIYRATPVFTPFVGENIDANEIAKLIQTWLGESKIKVTELFAASAIITGLAAQQANVAAIRQLILKQIPNIGIVAADDPHLESWLAFMGSCAALSRYHGETPILNLDIGGGTTNSALGENGNVLATGCHFIGARHFQFVPSSYQLRGVSKYGKALLENFAIKKTVGETLNEKERAQLINFYVQALEAVAQNNQLFFESAIASMHLQAAWNIPLRAIPKITFSGGVGEIVYQLATNKATPTNTQNLGTTFYGDFGIDLAQAIIASPVLSANLKSHVPENQGRATVVGLALNSTEVSGSSIYLPKPDLLPLHDIPILANLSFDAPMENWQQVLAQASARSHGACLQITQLTQNLQQVRAFAHMFSAEVVTSNLKKPLVLLIEGNLGKTLGNYITNWGNLGIQLIVIDEIATRDAHFVNLGKLQQGVIPVSFYGMY